MIRKAEFKDAGGLAKLAVLLWSSHSDRELKEEFEKLLQNNEAACFIKYEETSAVGFAQCQLRHDYVEGAKTSPVGYLEGIFVKENYRHAGFGKELLRACEQWAKEKGCTEFASDCELNNSDSFGFHTTAGFEEVNRIICFKKSI